MLRISVKSIPIAAAVTDKICLGGNDHSRRDKQDNYLAKLREEKER